MSSAALRLWKTFQDDVDIHSDTARKLFGFPSESLFDIIPESCSELSRNAVRLGP
jgi:hypothetical protein